MDTELALEDEGICVRFERIGDRYSISINQKELDPEQYNNIRDTIRAVLDRLIEGTGITMNIF